MIGVFDIEAAEPVAVVVVKCSCFSFLGGKVVGVIVRGVVFGGIVMGGRKSVGGGIISGMLVSWIGRIGVGEESKEEVEEKPFTAASGSGFIVAPFLNILRGTGLESLLLLRLRLLVLDPLRPLLLLDLLGLLSRLLLLLLLFRFCSSRRLLCLLVLSLFGLPCPVLRLGSLLVVALVNFLVRPLPSPPSKFEALLRFVTSRSGKWSCSLLEAGPILSLRFDNFLFSSMRVLFVRRLLRGCGLLSL